MSSCNAIERHQTYDDRDRGVVCVVACPGVAGDGDAQFLFDAVIPNRNSVFVKHMVDVGQRGRQDLRPALGAIRKFLWSKTVNMVERVLCNLFIEVRGLTVRNSRACTDSG